MKNKKLKAKSLSLVLASVMFGGVLAPMSAQAAVENGWEDVNGSRYWYENGVKQGTEGRGKEIYDPDSNAWYWLDQVDDGKMAVSKDVYQESKADDAGNIGKWVRYDANGHMVKGWNVTENGTYYFDLVYGTMFKGEREIDGVTYWFNSDTGVMESCDVGLDDHWVNIGGNDFWYEGGIRQGYDANDPAYRGKEIYDPGSDAWYWLDNVQQGAKAVGKDVYQESKADDAGNIGKWVRYDANGHMIKGWNTNENGTYYFDPVYGTMAKGIVTIEGVRQKFNNDTGIYEGEVSGSTHTYTTWRSVKEEILDGNDVVTEYIISEYSDVSNWRPAKRSWYDVADGRGLYRVEECVYNENDAILQDVYYDVALDGTKTESYRYEYKYDAEDRQTEYKYVNADDPERSYRYVYEYQGENCVKEEYYDHEDKLERRYEYDYDSAGNQTESRVYSFEDGVERLSSRTIYQYTANKLTQEDNEYYSVWGGESHTSYSRTVYHYDGDFKSESISAYKDEYSGKYVNSHRTTWKNDSKGNTELEVSYNWDSVNAEWVPRYKSEYTYMYIDRDNYSSTYQLTYDYYSKYDKDGKPAASLDEWFYQSGRKYERGENGVLEKAIYYTKDKEIDYYWVYENVSIKNALESYTETDRCYDKNGNQTKAIRYTYQKFTYEEYRER